MKKVILSALLAAGILPLAAQTSGPDEQVLYNPNKYKVETNTFWHNWFVSVGGGANIMFSDHDREVSFGKRIAPALDVAVGKWFTPGIGIRFAYQGLQARGASNTTQDGPSHSYGELLAQGSGYAIYKQKFNMYNIHGDVLFNFSNLFFGYKAKRVWSCSPYVGLGWARVWESPDYKGVTASLGVLNSFRLCDALDLNLDIRGMMTGEGFDGGYGQAEQDGLLSATIGLTYKFKQRGWDRSKTVVRYDHAALDEMRERLNQISAENEQLKRALAEGDKKEAHTIVKRMASANLVTFKIGKSKLTNEARANLGMLAEVIKSSDPDVVYTITGYADAGTGTRALNERLSKERAGAVYDCLVNEFGVSPSQLRVDHKGGVDNMFYDDPRLSRAVITKSE